MTVWCVVLWLGMVRSRWIGLRMLLRWWRTRPRALLGRTFCQLLYDVKYVDSIFNRNAYEEWKKLERKRPLNQIFGCAGSVSERELACGVLPRISSFLRYHSIFFSIFTIHTLQLLDNGYDRWITGQAWHTQASFQHKTQCRRLRVQACAWGVSADRQSLFRDEIQGMLILPLIEVQV